VPREQLDENINSARKIVAEFWNGTAAHNILMKWARVMKPPTRPELPDPRRAEAASVGRLMNEECGPNRRHSRSSSRVAGPVSVCASPNYDNSGKTSLFLSACSSRKNFKAKTGMIIFLLFDIVDRKCSENKMKFQWSSFPFFMLFKTKLNPKGFWTT